MTEKNTNTGFNRKYTNILPVQIALQEMHIVHLNLSGKKELSLPHFQPRKTKINS